MEVVVIENDKVPLVTIEIAVKNGAFTEDSNYNGLSHLFEHMFFKANKDYPDQAKFLKRTQELGAIYNGSTGDERVNYYFTFGKDSLAAGIAVYEFRHSISDLQNGGHAKRTTCGRRGISAC